MIIDVDSLVISEVTSLVTDVGTLVSLVGIDDISLVGSLVTSDDCSLVGSTLDSLVGSED